MLVCKQINPDLDSDLFQQNVDKIWYTMCFFKFFGRIFVIIDDKSLDMPLDSRLIDTIIDLIRLRQRSIP